jgi:hypothetical protein
MSLPRRKFLALAAGAAALSSNPRQASALDYPVKPVRVIVPFAAGGSTDIAGRLICQWLSERTGQQFIVENRRSNAPYGRRIVPVHGRHQDGSRPLSRNPLSLRAFACVGD